MDVDDDGFDLIQPSLIQQLRTILDQYPDDGQILKELIQNAEDAGARHVKFLHDKHSYGTARLHSDSLAQFQQDELSAALLLLLELARWNHLACWGIPALDFLLKLCRRHGPALYAYNSARFTKDDWKGIRMLCDSIKVKDPMKVGRFGLGFKSVFHVTDLPSIFSDTQIGVIDPHEEHFSDRRNRRTGYHWRLQEDCKAMDAIPDQFLPYKGIFDSTDDVFTKGCYNGTLFRFPLRAKPSELSQTLYSADKVHTLFESFMADAHLVLLFLQHLESIELYVREENDCEPKRIFQVKVANESLQIVQAKRKEFQSRIGSGKLMSEPVTATFPMTVETESFEDGIKRYSFLVSNYFCGGEISSEFKKLVTDKDLSYLPTVGVAMALPTCFENTICLNQGHVFCFLPLPVQKKSLTGLPVHVNGFFALSQNRRYIKTPSADQEDREIAGRHLTDKSLLWNKCLLEEAVPRAYCMLLLKAICESNYCIPAEVVLRAWPDLQNVDPSWKRTLKPLFDLLRYEKILYTHVQGGKWITVEEAIFDKLSDDDPKELIVQVLLDANRNIVSVPSHVLDAINTFWPASGTDVTSSLVRGTLKDSPSCYKDRTSGEKVMLLRFVLRDCNYSELLGLELLPVSGGKFTTFASAGVSQAIYIDSSDHPQELLPGLQHRFLDISINSDIVKHLNGVAKEGRTQLRHLSKDDLPALLPRSIPQEWLQSDQAMWYPDGSNNDHPPKKWIELLWEYLRKNFASAADLRMFENLPLIPLDMTKLPVVLVKLCLPSKIVVTKLNDDHLNNKLVDVLKQLGVVVLQNYPPFLSRHPAVLGNFVHPPSVHSVLKSLSVSSRQIGLGMHSALLLSVVSNDDKRALRSFIAKSLTLSPAEKKYLACLPLLETVSKRFVAKQDGLCAAPVEAIPVNPQKDLIDIKDDDCKHLAGLLDIRELKATEFLCEIVFPDVNSGSYSEEEVDKLMAYIIDRYAVYSSEDPRFKGELRQLPFVPNNVKRLKASDLFDPRKETLKELFAGEDVFPKGDLWNEPSVLVLLEDLGLKTESHISGQDLFQTAKQIKNMSCFSTAEIKSKSLMSYLCRNPSKLQEAVANERLGELLKDFPWISRLKERPQRFPGSLPLWIEPEKEKHLYKPRELHGSQHINLIGSVRPVIEIDPSNPVAECFGWRMAPHVIHVVEHLRTVTRCYNQEEKPYYMVVVKEIYAFLNIAEQADVKKAFERFELVKWVWNGDGFSSPKHVLSGKPFIDLSPYICSLPSEMSKYSNLFSNFGMPAVCDAFLLLQVLGMIKEKHDDGRDLSSSEVKHDLQLSIDILNEVKPGPSEQLSSYLQEMVLIPTVVEGNFIRLEPVDKCMYCEKDWLRMDDRDEDIDFFHVHPNIPNSTAELLGVPTLTNRMLDSDELSIGEEFGQEEKLTRRINRLLEDYTDGFAVPKELIQNADDAGATEVKFLYDERTNEDAMSCLIDEGMRECQGPALWVYNDAEFQDKDFENITKLNGGTKEQDTEKIGRFGLGFNAVYNLTDVPSFVSRNYIVYFDPHTVYLGKAIKDKGKPGIKIDTNKNVKRLRKFSNQFKPFNGIFDCDLHLSKDDNSFKGTLFRFPLRTKEQAIRSEIKQLYYDDKQMRDLLHLFMRGAKSLLLFTQNVFRVSVSSFPNSAVHAEPKLIFQVTKSLNSIVREVPIQVPLAITTEKLTSEEQRLLGQSNFLRASSDVAKRSRNSGTSSAPLLNSSMTVDIKSNYTEHSQHFFETLTHPKCDSETWLVASSMGNGQALQFSSKDDSLLPAGGVAVQLLQETFKSYLPTPVVDRDNGKHKKGTLFCYLPLPIHSGLPIQVNGAFSVAASRRHLSIKTEDDKTGIGVVWNNVLFSDSICSAYLDLLEDVKALCPPCGVTYRFHSLWPKSCEVETYCNALMNSFYKTISVGDCSVFSDGKRWVNINEVVFLDPDLREEPLIGNVSFQVLQILSEENKAVVDLPRDVFRSFEDCGLKEVIQAKTYTRRRFFRELFFPNISRIPSKQRDVLTLYALDDKNGEFDDMMKTCACIPSSPFGERLKRPGELVNPGKQAASLFSPDDGRFPFGCKETFLDSLRVAKLEQLGMLTDDLPWDGVAERTESIYSLFSVDPNAALERGKSLINFLQSKLWRSDSLREREPISESIWERILEAKFLPALKKPKGFPLMWKSDDVNHETGMLHSPNNVFLKSEKYLVCCTELLVSGHIPENVKRFLKLDKKKPTLKHVLCQLHHAISTSVDKHDFAGWNEVKEVCREAYQSLERAISTDEIQIKDYLQNKKFILVGETFVSASQVALKLNVDCTPYLYQLPEDLATIYPRLMKVAGVREVFEEKDFVSVLGHLQQMFGETRLDKRALQVTINLANLLAECLKTLQDDSGATHQNLGIVHLPDSETVMRPVTDLCINDCLWIEDDSEVYFAHSMIPWPTCLQLGVKTRREEALKDYSFGIGFGQKEKLTNRLKRILKGYPCEKEILKELLQNADDAQATEICFIKDPRHHPEERLFEECWKPLQGPALCVYNNKPFTKADIEGIQNLGEGSKGDDPNKTGQYGVGFNAVYHLTDVPSFKSMGKEIGDVLCVFDPHCLYVPGANSKEPGRMFKNTEKLKGRFPDVFPCYLEDHFSTENATMFRFPLRTEQMAKTSNISSTPVTLEELDAMMKELKKELFEVLLFVNHVRKISLSDLDERSGKIVNTYSVEVVMSEKDALERQQFSSHVQRFGKIVKETGNVLPTDIEVKKCSYAMTVRDSNGMEEKWLIVQQIGFERPLEESIANAYRNQELGMLPRGGVAWLLERKWEPKDLMKRPRKAFCFLPLPINTNLPVHINGHFALDHEARRNLWRDDGRGYRSAWNNALLQQVITSCYLTLFDEVRYFLELPTTHGSSDSSLSCSKSQIMKRVSMYESVFPTCPSDESYWKTLVISLYQEMNSKRLQLLPVVRNTQAVAIHDHGTSSEIASTIQLKWLPPTGLGENKAFFNNRRERGSLAHTPRQCDVGGIQRMECKREEEKTLLENILLDTGFNLLALSLSVFESFTRSGVDVVCITPSSVVEFYKTFNSRNPLCNIGPIPNAVHNTPFKNVDNVILVLEYCKVSDDFLNNISGLPLLLTEDNYLRTFQERDPKFLSRYQDILPGSKHEFVQEKLRSKIFGEASYLKVAVFRPFNVKELAANLQHTLPEYCGNGNCIKWNPDDKAAKFPNQRWVFRIWSFIRENVGNVTRQSDLKDQVKTSRIKDILWPLYRWSILPVTVTNRIATSPASDTLSPSFHWSILSATVTSHIATSPGSVPEHFLYPLRLAESVVDFTLCDATSTRLVDGLRLLLLPELNTSVISSSTYVSLEACDIARHLVASLKSPGSLLSALDHKMKSNPSALEGKLKPSYCRSILEYFSNNVGDLTDAHKQILRKLPFYLSTRGNLIALNNRKVCVLTAGIPSNEMDFLETRLNLVILKSSQSFAELLKFMGCESVSAVDVYCKFILIHFNIFSREARMAHLEYIRDSLLGKMIKSNETDRQRLLDCLRNVALVPTKDGIFKTAASFYDPHNVVFSAMLQDDAFPPEPFHSGDWLSLLKMIGLVHDVSPQQFKAFAYEIELEGETHPNPETYTKSQVLVSHLLGRQNVLNEGLLQDVRDIRFVATDPVKTTLAELCPQYRANEDGQTPYIAFKNAVTNDYTEIVWTTAHLLPRWADPRSYLVPRFCKHHSTLSDCLGVLVKPTVDLVARHCQTICFHLEKDNERKLSYDTCFSRMSVMGKIYRFLQRPETTASNFANVPLAQAPCILVEKGRRFVRPKQVVLELYENLEIKPFLYRVPPELGQFQVLFGNLGCSKSIATGHYVLVLEMLYERSMGNRLHPNELETTFKAVKGLFQLLQEKSETDTVISNLYLPGTPLFSGMLDEPVPVTLRKSTELIFNDACYWRDRIGNFEELFVVDLVKTNLRCSLTMNHKDLMMKLPSSARPKMLSNVVKEKLVESRDTLVTDISVAGVLKQQVSSPQFCRGIARLICHANSETGAFDERIVASTISRLQSIEFCGIENIVTNLIHNGVSIPGSEEQVPFFVEKIFIAGQEVWKVCVSAALEIEDNICTILTKVIADACEGLLRDTVIYVPQMLRAHPNKIWSLLNDMKIRQDDSHGAREKDVFPEPGSFIPIEDHHLLNQDFEEFSVGEYVGYVLYDPTLEMQEGEPTVIYAIIVEELGTEDVSFIFSKKYKINIKNGKESVVVEAADLYKFHRLQALTPALVVSAEQDHTASRDRQKIFDEISTVLEAAWTLPEGSRHKIIKRLYLRWHPDKNPGSETFCTEVFQHLKSEIARLERGESRGGFYANFFGFWGFRASRHRSHRHRYQEDFSRYYGCWRPPSCHSSWGYVPPSFCATNPQPGEAKRWFRQAKADLAAAENDISTRRPSYEWACFKCHQAAEKALKAAQFSVDAFKTNVHSLVQISLRLDDSQLTSLARQLDARVGDSTRMRYPDQVLYPQVPNDVYSEDVALEAAELARQILDSVKESVN